MDDIKIQRIILKNDDVLVIKLPSNYLRKSIATAIYEQVRKKLLPRTNKVLILPSDVDISVIAKEEVKEIVSKIDLWELWTKEEEIIENND